MPGVVHQVIERVPLPIVPKRRPELAGERGETRDTARVELEGNSLATEGLDFRDNGLGVLGATLVGQHDIAAMAGDGERDVAAEPAAGSGDEGDPGRKASSCGVTVLTLECSGGLPCRIVDVPCPILS